VSLSQQDILTMKQVFTEIVDAKFATLENLIKNITTDKATNKLRAMQQLYLRKQTLTIKEVTEAQLIGKYTATTVLAKLKHSEYCYKEGKVYKIITAAVVQYREYHNIK
jgi:hypothetical protein